MTYRELWIATYLAKASAGISPEKAAAIADQAVKQLKSRDQDAETGFITT